MVRTDTDRSRDSRNSRVKKMLDRRCPKQIAELAELRRQIPRDCGQLK
jgi:hypothetical protein